MRGRFQYTFGSNRFQSITSFVGRSRVKPRFLADVLGSDLFKRTLKGQLLAAAIRPPFLQAHGVSACEARAAEAGRLGLTRADRGHHAIV